MAGPRGQPAPLPVAGPGRAARRDDEMHTCAIGEPNAQPLRHPIGDAVALGKPFARSPNAHAWPYPNAATFAHRIDAGGKRSPSLTDVPRARQSSPRRRLPRVARLGRSAPVGARPAGRESLDAARRSRRRG